MAYPCIYRSIYSVMVILNELHIYYSCASLCVILCRRVIDYLKFVYHLWRHTLKHCFNSSPTYFHILAIKLKLNSTLTIKSYIFVCINDNIGSFLQKLKSIIRRGAKSIIIVHCQLICIKFKALSLSSNHHILQTFRDLRRKDSVKEKSISLGF